MTIRDKLIIWHAASKASWTLPLDRAEVEELLRVFEALNWIAIESLQYADGAPDATPAARFLTLVEQTARDVLDCSVI